MQTISQQYKDSVCKHPMKAKKEKLINEKKTNNAIYSFTNTNIRRLTMQSQNIIKAKKYNRSVKKNSHIQSMVDSAVRKSRDSWLNKDIDSMLPQNHAENKCYLNDLEKTNLKKRYERETEKIIKKLNYRGNSSTILYELIYRTDQNGISRVSQACLALICNCTVRTIIRAFKRFAQDGLITVKRKGWLDRETNIINVLFVQHLKPIIYDKMSHDLKYLRDLKDRDLKTYYSEYIGLSDDSEIRIKKSENSEILKSEKSESKKSKFIDPKESGDLTNSDNIKKLCEERGLTDEQICYVLVKMKEEGIVNPARYLYSILNGIQKGWQPSSIDKHKTENFMKTRMSTAEKLEKENTERTSYSRALRLAQERLKSEGHHYPTSEGKTPLEHLEALDAYGALEAKYRNEFLKQPSGPRPVISYPPREDWHNRYD